MFLDLSAPAVWTGDDFEEMTIGVFEIHPAAAVVAVELARLMLARVGPVFERARMWSKIWSNSIFTDEEGVVLRRDLVTPRTQW